MPFCMGIPATVGRQPLTVMGCLGNHFASNKDKNRRKAVVEETEQIHHAGQQKIECSQAEDGKHVRREDHKPKVMSLLVDDTKNGRHAVDGKEHVGAFHHQQHQEQGCCHPAASFLDEEPVTSRLVGHRDKATEEPQQEIIFRMNFFVGEGKFQAGVDKETAEEPEDPLKSLDQFSAHQHEGQSHQHRAENAPEEHPILVLQGHAEITKHDCKHEDVVHRQRPLNEIASEKLDGSGIAQPPPDQAVERKGEGRPDAGPEGTLRQRRLV